MKYVSRVQLRFVMFDTDSQSQHSLGGTRLRVERKESTEQLSHSGSPVYRRNRQENRFEENVSTYYNRAIAFGMSPGAANQMLGLGPMHHHLPAQTMAPPPVYAPYGYYSPYYQTQYAAPPYAPVATNGEHDGASSHTQVSWYSSPFVAFDTDVGSIACHAPYSADGAVPVSSGLCTLRAICERSVRRRSLCLSSPEQRSFRLQVWGRQHRDSLEHQNSLTLPSEYFAAAQTWAFASLGNMGASEFLLLPLFNFSVSAFHF